MRIQDIFNNLNEAIRRGEAEARRQRIVSKGFTDLKPRKSLETHQKMIAWRFMENLRRAIIHDKLNPTK